MNGSRPSRMNLKKEIFYKRMNVCCVSFQQEILASLEMAFADLHRFTLYKVYLTLTDHAI